MRHNQTYITMQAQKLIEQYGEKAVAFAQSQLWNSTNAQDVSVATMWLSITHEVQAILRCDSKIN